jgi:hypothetical protein
MAFIFSSVGTEEVSFALVEEDDLPSVEDERLPSSEEERLPKIDRRLFEPFGGGDGTSQPQSSAGSFEGTSGGA